MNIILLFSLKLSPVDERSFVFDNGSGVSTDQASPPVSVLVGEPGVGGVFETDCAGELLADNEKEAFRGGTNIGLVALFTVALVAIASRPAFSSSTVCEFDRRKRLMKPDFDVVRLIEAGRAWEGADTGRSVVDVEVFEVLCGVDGGVACVLTMTGFVSVGGVFAVPPSCFDCCGVI